MAAEGQSSVPAVAAKPRVFCKGCGYALVGLASCRCPECGRGFDLGNRRTFARRPPRGRVWRWGRRVLAVVLLLVLVAGAGLFWLWWGWRAEQGNVARLRAAEANIYLKPIGPNWLGRMLGERFAYLRMRVAGVTLDNQGASTVDALDLKALGRIEELNLRGCDVSGRALASVGDLVTLRELGLGSNLVDGLNLNCLARLPNLTKLDLGGERFHDADILQISALKHLRELSLNNTAVGNFGLQYLRGLDNLETLDLMNTSVTDAGLERLAFLPSLRTLYIPGERFSSKSVAQLKRAIPGLRVIDRNYEPLRR